MLVYDKDNSTTDHAYIDCPILGLSVRVKVDDEGFVSVSMAQGGDDKIHDGEILGRQFAYTLGLTLGDMTVYPSITENGCLFDCLFDEETGIYKPHLCGLSADDFIFEDYVENITSSRTGETHSKNRVCLSIAGDGDEYHFDMSDGNLTNFRKFITRIQEA